MVHNQSSNSQVLTTKKRLLGGKLAVGGAAIAATAIIGSAGVVAAQQFSPNSSGNNSGTPAIVAKCKANFRQLGFQNVGQCVSTLVHQQHGYGYGGHGEGDGDNDRDDSVSHNDHVSFNLTNNVRGAHNAISNFLSFVFG